MAHLIRSAKPDDLNQLCAMAQRFAEESHLPLTFDPHGARGAIWQIIYSDKIVLVEEDEGILTGFVLGSLEKDFCFETCAYINKFFVDREFRGLGTSRELLKAFEKEAKSRGADIIFAGTHSGRNERLEGLFVNLFIRAGYQLLGRTVTRKI